MHEGFVGVGQGVLAHGREGVEAALGKNPSTRSVR